MLKIFIFLSYFLFLFTFCNYQNNHSTDLSISPKLLRPLEIELKPQVFPALKPFIDTCKWQWDAKVFMVIVRQKYDHVALVTYPIELYSHLDEYFPEQYLFQDSCLFLFSNGENRLIELDKTQYLKDAEAVIGKLLRKNILSFDDAELATGGYNPPTAKITIERDSVYLTKGEEANIWDIPKSNKIRYVVPDPDR